MTNKVSQEQYDAACRRLLSTRDGRHLFYEIISQSNLFGLSFEPDSDRKTAFNEGRRVVGMNLMAVIDRVMPSAFDKMNAEAAERAEISKSQDDGVE